MPPTVGKGPVDAAAPCAPGSADAAAPRDAAPIAKVDGRVAPVVDPPPRGNVVVTACPDLPDRAAWWAEEIAPTCAPRPFTGINLCAGPCPRPCQIVSRGFDDSSTSTITYDADDRWLASSPAVGDDGAVDACAYGDKHRVSCTHTSSRYPKANSVKRNGSGRITQIMDADRPPITLAYDRAGHLISARSAEEEWTYTYDGSGRLVGQAEPKNQRTAAYRYNRAGELTERDDGRHKGTHHAWSNGRLVSAVSTDGSMANRLRTLKFGHDASGRPTTISFIEGYGSEVLGEPAFIYDCR